MHYKNGRAAKNGDKVVMIRHDGAPVFGVLIDAVPGNNSCNGNIIPIFQGIHYANLAECVHADDFKAGVPADFPDTSAK